MLISERYRCRNHCQTALKVIVISAREVGGPVVSESPVAGESMGL
ncbi:hypothetical protein HanIR_Chr08g0385451 [Helianthus annuus]|nr:hypothetical protein HanIR_Chr08g0385451 [Helianthus annuus]